MWKTSARYTFLKFLILTHLVLCNEFDITLLMENLVNKVKMQTKTIKEDIESLVEKLLGLKTIMNLLPLTFNQKAVENKLKTDQYTDVCQETADLAKKLVRDNSIQVHIRAKDEVEPFNRKVMDELKDFAEVFAICIPFSDTAVIQDMFLSIEEKLEYFYSHLDSSSVHFIFCENEMYLQSSFTGMESFKKPTTRDKFSTDKHIKGFQNVQISVNDSVKILRAEIFAVREKIDLTTK